ncbi:ATP-binding protein [Actinokineospora bangkokensis]|uniref:AAA family ATPase n=1 Tax=Actinokineospora bangkokensis TaxID=1193682 RepID=A0A1Q9LQT3_9PSEU|nr:DUF87 domain-containing protein [Actinokineospora bangkokensis]OLR94351.1 AAA family ATPase [Actinokineospora bangkokensis]
MSEQLRALSSLYLDSADTPDHVWVDSQYHVEGLHAEVIDSIDLGIRAAQMSSNGSPIGLVLQGLKGVGKTHLLGTVRRRVHAAEGYFFLNDLTTGEAFWDNTVDALRTGFNRPDASGETQLRSFLRRICEQADVPPEVTKVILGGKRLTREQVDEFVVGVRRLDRQVGVECADMARSLVLYGSDNQEQNDVGEGFLAGYTETRRGEREVWGIRARVPRAEFRVRDVTRLLALTGPLVVGVDQLDTLLNQAEKQADGDGNSQIDLMVGQVADGLMRLREVTRRTLTVLSCLPDTWLKIENKAADTVTDRFRPSRILGRIRDAEVGRSLIARRLEGSYAAVGFTPPHSTWPIAPSAFDSHGWNQFTPRVLLRKLHMHVEMCLRAGQVWELVSFDDESLPPNKVPEVEPAPVQVQSQKQAAQAQAQVVDRHAELDELFERLRASADVQGMLDAQNEDVLMPELLSTVLRAWITEVGDDNMEWECRTWSNRNEVHAWLTRTLDEEKDLEEHWAFRFIAVPDPRAALSRVRKAISATKLNQGADNRHLVLIRNLKWSTGLKTREELASFDQAGGDRLAFAEDDLRTYWALKELIAANRPDLHDWLVARRPASRSALLRAVLPEPPAAGETHPPPGDGVVVLGREVESGAAVGVELEALRKHAVVFAGSGSGKTVLLRRIIEECALLGVSSIVLDPNNDLARLGDPWPQPPTGWAPGDAEAARRYIEGTEVVVWTPARANGRPLAFQPLPDFAGVLDDHDEFAAAVEVAVAALAPQVRLTGSGPRNHIKLAVLKQVVEHFARAGSRSLPGLIALLEELPEDVSTLRDAGKIAAELAEALKAAMVNDPLFAGTGTPVDPGELLTPSVGKRARVSVISFVGLQSDAQRQSFVNQLQMELFSWFKRNPAGDRPLGGLFVMDEAQTLAAGGTMTASTRSTIVLASQARKYGLGLLFATQAPKGLHNQITGNAMTQFFGRLNSPAQIDAANEMARAKGSQVADISRLERAQFYVSGEAFGFRQVATPLCLSHHPASPLRLEEVLERARRG